MKTALFALVMTAVCTGAAAAQNPRDSPLPVPAGGKIAGAVVGSESGRAVRFARVTLISSGREQTVTTDDGGAFAFDRLPAGTYALSVSKPGYLDTKYGQARPGTDTPGRRIQLRDGEQLGRLSMPLSQGGSISGVIRDDRGDPIFRANVRVSRWVMRNGVRTLQTVDSTQSDERGLYRVSLLPPREYIVSAMPPESHDDEQKPPTQISGFVSMFYPSGVSARSASPIPLGLGSDRTGVDLQLPLVPLGRVTGVVIDRDGRPVPDILVALSDREHSDMEQGTQTDRNGRFEFDRLGPGTYVARAGTQASSARKHFSISYDSVSIDSAALQVSGDVKVLLGRLRERDMFAADQPAKEFEVSTAPAKTSARGSATADVSVTGGTISELVLTLDAPRTVAGRVVFDGSSSPPSLREAQVALVAADETGDDVEAKIVDDGTFLIPNVAPGRYRVTIQEPPPWVLTSAVAAGTEALDYLLEVPRDRDVRDLTLTLRDRSTQLSGAVTDAVGKPVGDRLVIVFAADERLWAAGSHRVDSVVLGDDGRFLFPRMRSGEYRLAVVDDAEPDEWMDPEFLRKLAAASVPVILAESQKKVQDLRVK